jgi:hypothetical protein
MTRSRAHPGADDRHFDRVLVIFPLDTPVARRESIFAKTFAGSGMLSAITPASGTALSTAAHIASAAAAVLAPVSAPPASPECLAQYSGSAIRLRQQKTGALLDVPVHPVLRDHLNALSRSETSLTIVSYRGRAVRYINFNDRFRRIAERAEIDAQARDLRRTAMLRMAEAGATAPQIASVSGHSIQATQRILETYLPRNRDLAEIAIARLAEYKRGSKV